MAIYTRTGDDGTTGLFGGKRILKSDPIINTCGALDECTSYLGLIATKKIHKQDHLLITKIQKSIYIIMGFLADAELNLHSLNQEIASYEKRIDSLEKKLPPLKDFLLPQGTEVSVQFHIARTICRRAERAVIKYAHTSKNGLTDPHLLTIVRYLNRLSDLLFTLARVYNTTNEKIVSQ